MTQDRTIEALEARLARRGESLEFLQIMTRTLASLALGDAASIADTLTSMAATFAGAETAFVLLLEETDDRYAVHACQGTVDRTLVTSPTAETFWRSVARERVPRFISGRDLETRWPDCPETLRGGFAAVTIELRDDPLGVLVLADKRSGEPFSEEDLEFLGGVVSIGAMALSNAASVGAQKALVRDVERRAEEARRLAEEREQARAELDRKLEVIERQQVAIRELSTPVLSVWEGVLALPIIGTIDTRRSASIMERLLQEVIQQEAHFVLIDVTGVEVVDTQTADHFIKVVQAAELLGTTCILTGIRPAVAQTLVELGVDLSQVHTYGTLRDGLERCLLAMRDQRPRVAHTDGRHANAPHQ